MWYSKRIFGACMGFKKRKEENGIVPEKTEQETGQEEVIADVQERIKEQREEKIAKDEDSKVELSLVDAYESESSSCASEVATDEIVMVDYDEEEEIRAKEQKAKEEQENVKNKEISKEVNCKEEEDLKDRIRPKNLGLFQRRSKRGSCPEIVFSRADSFDEIGLKLQQVARASSDTKIFKDDEKLELTDFDSDEEENAEEKEAYEIKLKHRNARRASAPAKPLSRMSSFDLIKILVGHFRESPSERRLISNSVYKPYKSLGDGAFGSVILSKNLLSNEFVAIKI